MSDERFDFTPGASVKRLPPGKHMRGVCVRFDPDMIDAIAVVAAADGRTVSNWIRKTVSDALTAIEETP